MQRDDTEDVPKPPSEKTEVRSVLGLEDNPFDDDGSTRVRPVSSDTDPLIGVEAGEYRILSALGVGSMGLVYKGAHQANGRIVAIKVLKRALIADPSQQRRFLDEARAVAACNHPGIIDVFSVGQLASDEPYLVMEFLEGEPLDARLARDRRLSVDEVLDFGIAIASALHAAHGAGVIHRDLKPPNIFLVKKRDGAGFTPKLIDFGLAQRVQGGERREQTSIGGTPLYLAPEQARREPITPQADLYSFGCVLFELLSGKPPFTAGNLHALLDQHASLAPVPLRELVTDVPRPLEKLVLSMLAKAPDDRPESADVVRTELERIRADRSPLRRPPPPPDEKTTVSFVHQPREDVSTEPEGVAAAKKRGPASAEAAVTVANLEPLPPVRESSGARLARLTAPTLDTGGDDPLPPPKSGARRRTGEHAAAARTRTGEQPGATMDESARVAQPPRRTGEVRTPRARTGEGPPLEPAADVEKERRPPRASQTNLPAAPAPTSGGNKLVLLVIAAAVVVLSLGVAIALKLSGDSTPPQDVPEAVKTTTVKPRDEVPPVEVKPVEETPVVDVQPRDPPQVDGPRERFKAELARVSKRVATMPKAARVKASRRLEDLERCEEPPETCLQQLRKLERKWFKR